MSKATGTRLFGWCLPDMPISQHEKCIHYSGPIDQQRECPCECHIDLEQFKKQKTTVTKPKRGKK